MVFAGVNEHPLRVELTPAGALAGMLPATHDYIMGHPKVEMLDPDLAWQVSLPVFSSEKVARWKGGRCKGS